MKPIYIIAVNTFREIIRDRILYGIIVFALLLISMSLALGQLTFAEQARISANFGFTGIHISAVVLAIFVGSTLVAREIDKKTILTILVRPLSRLQFVIGKALGLIFVISFVISCLALVLMAVFYGLKVDINFLFFIGLYGVLLEAIILLAYSLLFSSFTRPIMVVSSTAGVFFIGHWLNDLKFFAEKSDSIVFKQFETIVKYIVPNFERFNWRSLVIYNEQITFGELFWASSYAVGWFFVLILITALIIRRKDFA